MGGLQGNVFCGLLVFMREITFLKGRMFTSVSQFVPIFGRISSDSCVKK